MIRRSKILRLSFYNIGCVGEEGISIDLDDVVCLVGRNNVGKSTILNAYELALGSRSFDPKVDRCGWAKDDEPSEVRLDVHIPPGIANIGDQWKIIENGFHIIRSRWQWKADTGFKKPDRSTWDPAINDWAPEGKVSGADSVFRSRLPRVLRVGSLEDADKAESVLLTLALEPLLKEVAAQQKDPESAISRAVSDVISKVNIISKDHSEHFENISQRVRDAFSGVFPGIGLKLNISMASPTLKMEDLVRAGSGIRVQDEKTETSLQQQGTGTRRALFWSMIRVHNEMKRSNERRADYKKSLMGQISKAKGDVRDDLNARMAAFDAGGPIPEADDDPALPGYLLLIDEPENALHPMASRAAQRHLYELAADPDWQVIMTTHSPYFINPLADHTTIVRLERSSDGCSALKTRMYRSDGVTFSGDEKAKLQALQNMDVSFSEVFFGSYPVLVEGDTEHAAFLAAALEENHPLANQITIVRARGKAILPALVKMLHHFQIDFGIIHDTDWPFGANGAASMWSVNASIHKALSDCREDKIIVRHRVSVPDFERFLGSGPIGKDKPVEAYELIRNSQPLRQKVLSLMEELIRGKDYGVQCLRHDREEYLNELDTRLRSWAAHTGNSGDSRLSKPEKS